MREIGLSRFSKTLNWKALCGALWLSVVAASADTEVLSRGVWSDVGADARAISSLYDLCIFYEQMVDVYMPLATPAPKEPMRISGNPSILVIDPDSAGWPAAFMENLRVEYSHGVATYPIIIEQDDQYRYIYNADDELLASVPLLKKYDRYAFLRERYPFVFSARVRDAQMDWLLGIYDANRVVLKVTLMTPGGYLAWRAAVEVEAEQRRLAEAHAPAAPLGAPGFAATEVRFDGTHLFLGWNPDNPANYHAVERTRDLLSPEWTPLYWAQGMTNWSQSVTTNDPVYASYRVVEFDAAWADSSPSGNGLTALQAYLLGLDPDVWDSSGDGIPDGAAVLAGTDPLRNTLQDGAVFITYEYDEHDRLVSATTATRQLDMDHDDAGNVASVSFDEVTP